MKIDIAAKELLDTGKVDLNGEIFEETFPVGFLQNNGEFDVADYTLTPDNDTLYIEYDAFKVSDGSEVDLDGLVGIEFSQFPGFLHQPVEAATKGLPAFR